LREEEKKKKAKKENLITEEHSQKGRYGRKQTYLGCWAKGKKAMETAGKWGWRKCTKSTLNKSRCDKWVVLQASKTRKNYRWNGLRFAVGVWNNKVFGKR